MNIEDDNVFLDRNRGGRLAGDFIATPQDFDNFRRRGDGLVRVNDGARSFWAHDILDPDGDRCSNDLFHRKGMDDF